MVHNTLFVLTPTKIGLLLLSGIAS